MNYVTVSGKYEVNVKPDEYLVVNPPYPYGLCIFKVLIIKAHIDSNATSGMIRTILSNLNRKI